MAAKKNEIESLIDEMISNGNHFASNLKSLLPDSLSESVDMFQESNVSNLEKIKEFLNR